MSWQVSLIKSLRVILLDDLVPYTYSDAILTNYILIAANLVLSDMSTILYDYSITFEDGGNISPDPLLTCDYGFSTLILLRVASMIEENVARGLLSSQGYKARLGPMNFTSFEQSNEIKNLLDDGYLKSYNKALFEYNLTQNIHSYRSLLSPASLPYAGTIEGSVSTSCFTPEPTIAFFDLGNASDVLASVSGSFDGFNLIQISGSWIDYASGVGDGDYTFSLGATGTYWGRLQSFYADSTFVSEPVQFTISPISLETPVFSLLDIGPPSGDLNQSNTRILVDVSGGDSALHVITQSGSSDSGSFIGDDSFIFTVPYNTTRNFLVCASQSGAFSICTDYESITTHTRISVSFSDDTGSNGDARFVVSNSVSNANNTIQVRESGTSTWFDYNTFVGNASGIVEINEFNFFEGRVKSTQTDLFDRYSEISSFSLGSYLIDTPTFAAINIGPASGEENQSTDTQYLINISGTDTATHTVQTSAVGLGSWLSRDSIIGDGFVILETGYNSSFDIRVVATSGLTTAVSALSTFTTEPRISVAFEEIFELGPYAEATVSNSLTGASNLIQTRLLGDTIWVDQDIVTGNDSTDIFLGDSGNYQGRVISTPLAGTPDRYSSIVNFTVNFLETPSFTVSDFGPPVGAANQTNTQVVVIINGSANATHTVSTSPNGINTWTNVPSPIVGTGAILFETGYATTFYTRVSAESGAVTLFATPQSLTTHTRVSLTSVVENVGGSGDVVVTVANSVSNATNYIEARESGTADPFIQYPGSRVGNGIFGSAFLEGAYEGRIKSVQTDLSERYSTTKFFDIEAIGIEGLQSLPNSDLSLRMFQNASHFFMDWTTYAEFTPIVTRYAPLICGTRYHYLHGSEPLRVGAAGNPFYGTASVAQLENGLQSVGERYTELWENYKAAFPDAVVGTYMGNVSLKTHERMLSAGFYPTDADEIYSYQDAVCGSCPYGDCTDDVVPTSINNDGSIYLEESDCVDIGIGRHGQIGVGNLGRLKADILHFDEVGYTLNWNENVRKFTILKERFNNSGVHCEFNLGGFGWHADSVPTIGLGGVPGLGVNIYEDLTNMCNVVTIEALWNRNTSISPFGCRTVRHTNYQIDKLRGIMDSGVAFGVVTASSTGTYNKHNILSSVETTYEGDLALLITTVTGNHHMFPNGGGFDHWRLEALPADVVALQNISWSIAQVVGSTNKLIMWSRTTDLQTFKTNNGIATLSFSGGRIVDRQADRRMMAAYLTLLRRPGDSCFMLYSPVSIASLPAGDSSGHIDCFWTWSQQLGAPIAEYVIEQTGAPQSGETPILKMSRQFTNGELEIFPQDGYVNITLS